MFKFPLESMRNINAPGLPGCLARFIPLGKKLGGRLASYTKLFNLATISHTLLRLQPVQGVPHVTFAHFRKGQFGCYGLLKVCSSRLPSYQMKIPAVKKSSGPPATKQSSLAKFFTTKAVSKEKADINNISEPPLQRGGEQAKSEVLREVNGEARTRDEVRKVFAAKEVTI